MAILSYPASRGYINFLLCELACESSLCRQPFNFLSCVLLIQGNSLSCRYNLTPVSNIFETAQKFLFWTPPMYQDLSTCHDWPVKQTIVDAPIRMKENLERPFW